MYLHVQLVNIPKLRAYFGNVYVYTTKALFICIGLLWPEILFPFGMYYNQTLTCLESGFLRGYYLVRKLWETRATVLQGIRW